MIGLDAAVRIVEEELEREYRRESELGIRPHDLVVVSAVRHDLVWIVEVAMAEYVRTRDADFLLVGAGPYLVDRLDGGLHSVGAVSWASGAWETDYRVRIRGEAVRTAVDELHDEVRAAVAEKGRLPAMRLLRQRVPVLALSQAAAYVTGLSEGAAPAELLAVVTRELVPPVDPVMAVDTIRAG
ncbi:MULTISPECIES: YrhB domain-containing protein [unclassified Streptomyces]|uniref:YrhB domain-containing protein n=1 Tax=unclassified Streptomyces TaxID=2593676 RepID=UPI002E80F0D4|nr:YrhB domain-containing protein [Streptomyces sp. NBC_00566]WUB86078.1 YrhB family protein [Streptomyces sp. NBC_00566]